MRASAAALALVLSLVGVGCAPVPVTAKARSLVYQRRDAEAETLLRDHLAKAPADMESRRVLIHVLARRSDLRGVQSEVEAERRLLPNDDPTPDIDLGEAYEMLHRYDEALEAYDHAASIAPTSPLGPRAGGLRAARWGECELAVPRLQDAIARGGQDAETYHALGLCLVHTDHMDEARRAYEAGAKLEHDGITNLTGLATVALRANDFVAALDAYTRASTKQPRAAALHLGRAYCLARLGRDVEAEQALTQAEALAGPSSHSAKIRTLLGKNR